MIVYICLIVQNKSFFTEQTICKNKLKWKTDWTGKLDWTETTKMGQYTTMN